VPGGFTDPLQFLVLAEFVGPLPLRQIFAYPGKVFKPVLPQKKPVDRFRVVFSPGGYGVKTANCQLTGQFITHYAAITSGVRIEFP
jgi:hypothetical protein